MDCYELLNPASWWRWSDIKRAYLLLLLFSLTSLGQLTVKEEYRNNFPEEEVWQWSVDEYPHPRQEPRFCGRFARSFVCDPDFIIQKHEADELDRLIQRIQNETRCICASCLKVATPRGITIGVALMRNMVLHDPRHDEKDSVRDFAERLRKKWNLGHCDDDIILLISTRDQQSYTDVGPAVSAVFPKEVADQIYLESRGHFTSGSYYQGLRTMVQSYFDMLTKLNQNNVLTNFAASQAASGSSVGLIVGIVISCCVMMVIIVSGVYFASRRRYGGGGTPSGVLHWIRKKVLHLGRRPSGWQRRNRITKAEPVASSQQLPPDPPNGSASKQEPSEDQTPSKNEPSASESESDYDSDQSDCDCDSDCSLNCSHDGDATSKEDLPMHLQILKETQLKLLADHSETENRNHSETSGSSSSEEVFTDEGDDSGSEDEFEVVIQNTAEGQSVPTTTSL